MCSKQIESKQMAFETGRVPVGVMTGAYCGPYKLLRPLGEGHCGVVWIGSKDDNNDLCAIKITKENLAPVFYELFRKETEILARLSHPCIPKFYDSGMYGSGMLWHATEYIESTELSGYCDKTPLPLECIIFIINQLCNVLCYLYQNHILHRDLNVSNVILALNGCPYIIDFGMAQDCTSVNDQRIFLDVEGLVTIFYKMAACRAKSDVMALKSENREIWLSLDQQKLIRHQCFSIIRKRLTESGFPLIPDLWLRICDLPYRQQG